MWHKLLPWKFLVKRIARSQGILDPVSLLNRFNSFGKPAENVAPTELLRAGIVMHARGLLNSQVIQHNLDWIWPWWVNRQFDPRSPSFIPRAFSVTHINLTHRNWTAVGLPGCEAMPIVDPRGLVTPLLDGWSVDAWIIGANGTHCIPSHMQGVEQRLEDTSNRRVVTRAQHGGQVLQSSVGVERNQSQINATIRYTASSDASGWLVVAVRPCNPEGISSVNDLAVAPHHGGLVVNNQTHIRTEAQPDATVLSEYQQGDVFYSIASGTAADNNPTQVHCAHGMANGALLYALQPRAAREIRIAIDLGSTSKDKTKGSNGAVVCESYSSALKGACKLSIDNRAYQRLYEVAQKTMALHSPADIYAGPYTYKRFWFRDAALIAHAMAVCGMGERALRALERFIPRQNGAGYFVSQDGEWDANGQVLWALDRIMSLTNQTPGDHWWPVIKKAAHWIEKKRLSEDDSSPHGGLFPAGFSAEHLGPNDYYYWDDFWGVAGLQAAARLATNWSQDSLAQKWSGVADSFMRSIGCSLDTVAHKLGSVAMPSSPYRRLDSSAVGSLAAGYPLKLFAPGDPRLLETVEFLLDNCMVDNGLFHDVSHAGINPYLTLHIAQVLLRNSDVRYRDLMGAIAGMASPTGQWPEAIHPQTKSGCMGDGQHVWAAAEWVMMVQECFVHEERMHNQIVAGRGIQPAWYAQTGRVQFGPVPTSYGTLTQFLDCSDEQCRWRWRFKRRGGVVTLRVAVPGFKEEQIEDPSHEGEITLTSKGTNHEYSHVHQHV
jgi:hypothetical protein